MPVPPKPCISCVPSQPLLMEWMTEIKAQADTASAITASNNAIPIFITLLSLEIQELACSASKHIKYVLT